ncbi:hypothetical protein LTR85_008265 [Meristemomyces frigidus]|nr:hypothetical protein LTR85_008265 [Meristemomyces frigidus]
MCEVEGDRDVLLDGVVPDIELEVLEQEVLNKASYKRVRFAALEKPEPGGPKQSIDKDPRYDRALQVAGYLKDKLDGLTSATEDLRYGETNAVLEGWDVQELVETMPLAWLANPDNLREVLEIVSNVPAAGGDFEVLTRALF